MKKSIFTLMFLAVMGFVSAQTLQFEWNGTVFNEGETIECTNDEYGYGELIQHMELRNLTSEPMKVLIEKEVIQDLEGVTNSFCWGMCFGPDTYVSPEAVEVQANSLNVDELSFHALYEEEVYGDVIVKYYAYEERMPDQRISIIVRFRKSGVGLNETSSVYFGQPYPNPASSMVSFDYNMSGSNATAVVYNLVGQEVMRQEINTFDGKMSLSVADLNDGIYFCSVMRNGQTFATVKFVVKK